MNKKLDISHKYRHWDSNHLIYWIIVTQSHKTILNRRLQNTTKYSPICNLSPGTAGSEDLCPYPPKSFREITFKNLEQDDRSKKQ